MNPLSAHARTLRSLKRLPLVASLDADLWASLIPHIELRELVAGDVLFAAGRASENLYLVIDGELALYFDMPANSSDGVTTGAGAAAATSSAGATSAQATADSTSPC